MKSLLAALLVTFLTPSLRAAEYPEPPSILHLVAIDNVCAWPSLTRLRDGTFIATIHNEPSHGQHEGDVDCWASADGEFWQKLGTPALHEPQTIRMNHAAGLAQNGDLLVLCSGWTNVQQAERPKQEPFRDAVLRNWVCRSSDGGRTWTQLKDFTAPEPGWTEFIPFGDISVGADGALHVSCYQGQFTDPAKTYKTKAYRSWHLRSDDDGKTWRAISIIGPKHNETALFHLGGKSWLAAARVEAMDLFRSDDDGETWQAPLRVTERNQINGHLARLADGRLVLTFGNRVKDETGVCARLSSDEGKTWGPTLRLARTLDWDCGYPSSAPRADGKIVTVFYAKRAASHERYHMGAAIWAAPAK